MFCINCGKNNVDHAKFCLHCGSGIPEIATGFEGTNSTQSSELPRVESPENVKSENGSKGEAQTQRQAESPSSNAPVHVTITNEGSNNIDAVNVALAAMNSKSVGLSFVLTLFFGALGLFYASVGGALVMLILVPILIILMTVAGAISFPTFLALLFGQWTLCIVWGVIAVKNHNNRLLAAIKPLRQSPKSVVIEPPCQTSVELRPEDELPIQAPIPHKPNSPTNWIAELICPNEPPTNIAPPEAPVDVPTSVEKTTQQSKSSSSVPMVLLILGLGIALFVALIFIDSSLGKKPGDSKVSSAPLANANIKSAEPAQLPAPALTQPLGHNLAINPPVKKTTVFAVNQIRLAGLTPIESSAQDVRIKMYPYTVKDGSLQGRLDIGGAKMMCAAVINETFFMGMGCVFGNSKELFDRNESTLDSAEVIGDRLEKMFKAEFVVGQLMEDKKWNQQVWINENGTGLVLGVDKDKKGGLIFFGNFRGR